MSRTRGRMSLSAASNSGALSGGARLRSTGLVMRALLLIWFRPPSNDLSAFCGFDGGELAAKEAHQLCQVEGHWYKANGSAICKHEQALADRVRAHENDPRVGELLTHQSREFDAVRPRQHHVHDG